MESYDVVVIGGGHNGLVAGAYLAKNGFKTLILEKRDVVGGACITGEVIPGFKISKLAYTVGLFHRTVINELDLKRFGYKAYPYEVQDFFPLPNNKYLMAYSDLEKTVKWIEKFSERDAKEYLRFEALLDLIGELADYIITDIPPNLDELIGVFDDPDILDLFKLLFLGSAYQVLDEYFESEEFKSYLASNAVIGASLSPSDPGTAYNLLHHFLLEVDGKKGVWGWVKGGMGMISKAIADAAKAYGADIWLNSEVEKIIVEDGVAKGVVLRDGREIRSKIVVSNADPITTLLKLVGRDHLDKNFVKRLERIRYDGYSAKINIALDGLPKFRAIPSEGVGEHHMAMIEIMPDRDYIEDAFRDARHGKPSEKPFLEMAIPSVYDDTLTPKGKHVLSIFVQYAPYKLRNGTWEDVRNVLYENTLSVLEEYTLNIRDLILGYEVITPYDLEKIYSLPHGHIFHIDMTPDQLGPFRPLAGYSDYTTPVKNLYLCGAGTHPGGGVMGLPGRNAAMKIMMDMKKPFNIIERIKKKARYSKLASIEVKRRLKKFI